MQGCGRGRRAGAGAAHRTAPSFLPGQGTAGHFYGPGGGAMWHSAIAGVWQRSTATTLGRCVCITSKVLVPAGSRLLFLVQVETLGEKFTAERGSFNLCRHSSSLRAVYKPTRPLTTPCSCSLLVEHTENVLPLGD